MSIPTKERLVWGVNELVLSLPVILSNTKRG